MEKKTQRSEEQRRQELEQKQQLVHVAAGRIMADLVLKNATYLNVFSNELCRGDIAVVGGRVAGIGEYTGQEEYDMTGKLVLPGLMDSHIHLESAMVSPAGFVRAVLPHGTTAVIVDPHEIANVMGTDGIAYLLQATQGLPVDVYVMLPSCVPATPLDESGAILDWQAIDRFYDHPRVCGLAEVMNYVGVAAADAHVLEKLTAAQAHGKQIDGHAPGLSGRALNAYAASGVRSDHECSDLEDALAKLRLGQHIMIREGTAARNLDALLPLLTPQYADRCMFCCDDRHPSDLLEEGHVDHICRRAIAAGADPILTVKAATINTARYFGLEGHGAIAPGYRADFTVIDSFEQFQVLQTYKNGSLCFNGCVRPFAGPQPEASLVQRAHDTFHLAPLQPEDFRADRPLGVIGLVDGEIVTTDNGRTDGADSAADILKVAVIERHKNTGHIGLGYLQGYGLKSGAVATSISHDSHNLIVVGVSDEDMAYAANRVVENRGGIVVAKDGAVTGQVVLELAGILTDAPLETVNEALEAAKKAALAQGVNCGIDPFMTLSFMALPVIPTLRLTTRGMFDVTSQQYV